MLVTVIREFVGLRLLLAGLRMMPEGFLKRELAAAVVTALVTEIARGLR